jgi:serine protease Do
LKRRHLLSLPLALPLIGWRSPAFAGLPDTIVRVKGSVLLVGTYVATDSPRFQLRGTGFLVGDGRLVVTSAHVLPPRASGGNASALVVQVRKGSDEWEPRAVTTLGVDVARDLALLRMEGPPGPALTVGDSRVVQEGDALAFMGFPIGGLLGYSAVTHRAVVSSITTDLNAPFAEGATASSGKGSRSDPLEIFQLDGTAYPGNSGGPLFHQQTGEVLGVMNMVLIKSTREAAMSQPSGISYAIPSRYVVELLARHR